MLNQIETYPEKKVITILILVAILAPMILVFSDRAIENISPKGTLANLSDEMDDIMISVNDNETALCHSGKKLNQ